MENAAEALKMAAFVLLFVLALSISINAFGEARQSAKIILDSNDREYDYSYIMPLTDGNGDIIRERTVRGETIVPTIYKAYKENYKIVILDANSQPIELYKKNTTPVSYIDLEKEVLGSNEQKEKFIKLLLKGTRGLTDTNSEDYKANENLKQNGIQLSNDGLYDKIKGESFIEKLGVYYQEEIQGESNTPDANKTIKKVITYVQI
ncbi:MAG: hypothetical protein HFJ35_05665 [Clostridia bacterium]|nr:hypothetical protein [Clostridia bacterium]